MQTDTTQRHLDEGRITAQQRFIAFVALFGLFLDGYDLLVLAGALLGLVPYLKLTPVDIGILGASAFVGMVFGSLIAGRLTDKFGRRPVFFADILLFTITALMFGVADSLTEILILRFLIGVAIGADMPTSLAIVTEFVPKHLRGRLLALGNGFWIGGAAVGGMVAVAVFSFVEPLVAWRWVLVSGAVPSIILFFLRRNVPETPRWLLSQGRDSEGAAISRSTGSTLDAAALARTQVGRGLPIATLFRNRTLRTALIVQSVFWAITNMVGSGILLYTPTVIKSLVTPSLLTALQFSVAINCLVVIANVVGVLWIIDKFGRRLIAIVPSIVIGVTLVVLALAAGDPLVVVIGFGLVSILNSGFVVGAYYAWGSELFPTSVRGTAIGISNGAGKLGSVLGVVGFPVLFAKSPTGSFLLLAGLILINIISLLFAAPETKGVSLDELEGAVTGERA